MVTDGSGGTRSPYRLGRAGEERQHATAGRDAGQYPPRRPLAHVLLKRPSISTAVADGVPVSVEGHVRLERAVIRVFPVVYENFPSISYIFGEPSIFNRK